MDDYNFDIYDESDSFSQENLKEKFPSYGAQVIIYLYSLRTPFDARKGLKHIHASLERKPFTQALSKQLKAAFEYIEITPHSSGEYSVPEHIERFKYLEHAEFHISLTQFNVPKKKKSDFSNERDYNQYLIARDEFMRLYYVGSQEEAEDKSAEKEAKAKKYQDAIQAAKDELKFLSQGYVNAYEVPEECSFCIVNETTIQMTISSAAAYFETFSYGMYFLFRDGESKHGVQYRLKENFRLWNFHCDNSQDENKNLLEKCILLIDKIHYNGEEMLLAFKKSMINSIRVPAGTSYDKSPYLDVIENYFKDKILDEDIW